MNFGLSGYLAVALAAALAVAGAASWAALHEYGVAKAQASRDRAQIAQAQAQATAAALKQQQAIDAKQAAELAAMQAKAGAATAWLDQFKGVTVAQASSASRSIRTIIRTEPPTACARQPIPASILAQLNAH
ncbi:MAG: hypothetical protein KGI82_00305 [Betaproteobacteria bacterium]|nr:hypothetical protein [Betaproteobacteria bacterium]